MLAKLTSLFWTKPKTMETNVIRLPPDLPNWFLVKELLQTLQERLISETISDQETCWFMQIIYNTSQAEQPLTGNKETHLHRLKSQIQSSTQRQLDHNCLWFGLLKYLRKVSREEKDKFLYTILPNVIEFAVGIEESRPAGQLHVSKQQRGGSVTLPRQFVCSIVACFFLSLFPERKKESCNMNIINFTAFFRHLPQPSQVAKLRCFLHYFECIMETGAQFQGNIVFCRKVAPLDWMLTLDELVQCDLKLCPLHIHMDGRIEDSGPDTLQVCFGNKSIGGGVLWRSAVQEEILFSTCPELMAAMLFMEDMKANEAILISGFQQFSAYSGYGDSFQFAGPYSEHSQIHSMVTIDAASYRETPVSQQFEESSFLRDLNKALIGFSWVPGTDSGQQQPWNNASTDGQSPGAVDVAADIVTSAMTDALRQAAQSPVDPETPELSAHPSHHSSSHCLHLRHCLSSHCCQQQQSSHGDRSCGGAVHLQEVCVVVNPSSVKDHAAEQTLLKHSVTSSRSLQAVQTQDPTTDHSSPTVSSVCVTKSLESMSSSSSSPISALAATASHPQILVQRSGYDTPKPYRQECQGLTAKHPTSVIQHLTHSPLTSSSFSDKTSGHLTDSEAAAEFSAFRKASQNLLSLQTHPDTEGKITCDVLGNFPQITAPCTEGVVVKPAFQEPDEHFTRQIEMSQKPDSQSGLPCAEDAKNIVIELSVPTTTNVTEASSASLKLEAEKTGYDESAFSRDLKSLTDDKYEDIVNSIDVVLSLPALQSEFERMSSGLSSSSLAVNVDSQSVSANSAEEESIRQLSTEVLYINVDNHEPPANSWNRDKSDGRTSSIDSVLLEPPFSASPQSSVSSSNVSPNTSFLVSEPPNGSSDVHAVAEFFIPGLDGTGSQVRQLSRRGSRDFYGELRDFLSSSSSGSRGSGSGCPLSSTNSSWGSRSGSLSSHGTNGSTIDFPEFWSNFRRRSSQLSDATSRRSSSSKHSSDFSTDLEEIAEGTHRHDHGVIEEEGSYLSVITEFACSVVSAAVRSGVATASHMSSVSRQRTDGHDSSRQLHPARLSTEESQLDQQDTDSKLPDRAAGKECVGLSAVSASEDISESVLLTCPEDKVVPPSSSPQHRKAYGLTELKPQTGHSSPSRAAGKYLMSSSGRLIPSLTSHSQQTTAVTSAQVGLPPSASHSIDSGFSSGVSSMTFISEHKTLESLSEQMRPSCSVRLPVTHVKHSHSESQTSHPATDGDNEVAVTMSASSFTTILDLDESSESTSATANIPLSAASDKTPYAVLESKTICGAEIVPELTSMEQVQLNPEDTGMQRASLQSGRQQKNETFKVMEYVQSKVDVSKKKFKHPTSSSLSTVDVPRFGPKHFRRQKAEDETSGDFDPSYPPQNQMDLETSLTAESTAVVCSSPEHITPHPLSGAAAPTKLSAIPKIRDKRLSYAESSALTRIKSSSLHKTDSLAAKEKLKDIKKDRLHRDSSSSHSRTDPNKTMLKSHKSRYVFSDVAAPLTDKRKSKAAAETLARKQNDKKTVRKPDEKRRKQHGDSTRYDPVKLTRSQKFIRFVNSIAEMSVSQAVLEGAEILAQRSTGHREVSDELYSWFATKIVTEVFLHALRELDVQQSSPAAGLVQSGELAAAADLVQSGEFAAAADLVQSSEFAAAADLVQSGELAAADDDASTLEHNEEHNARREEMDRAEAAGPKPKSILPTKVDAQTLESRGLGLLKLYGSLKVVTFKDSQGGASLSPSPQQPPHTATTAKNSSTPTFHRQSSNIPIPIRRRNSLDLPLLSSSSSPPAAAGLCSSKLPSKSISSPLSSSQQRQPHGNSCGVASLTSKDLSIDVFQAAATIVSQVLQAVSDSMDSQTLSPVSSGWHGTLSSSDTAIHSTGSKLTSTYDSMTSNIFSSSSAKVSESPRRARRSVSPSIGIFSRKPMSRETLTNAFLKVDSTPIFKTYERRSSEPCQTSVQLSLQAFNSIKFSKQAVEDKQRKISRTDDDIGCGKTWRRGSLDGFSFERRNSCGFKDPVLSRFAEELMKADTSVPELVIVGSHPSSSSTGSRRSSIGAFKESAQANMDMELLNTSFTSICSLPVSHSSRSQSRRTNMDRSRSRESRNWKSDSSDTEYWFPPPRIVGDEFQQEYNRQHSQEELQDYASFFAGRVVQEAVCVLKCDPDYMSKDQLDIELFAENLMDQIMRDAMLASLHADYGVRRRHEGDLAARGDGCQNHSADTENNTHRSGYVDDQRETYHAEGARPKTSFPPPRTRSKTKSIPQRRDARRRASELDLQRAEDSSHVSRHVSDQKMRRASTFSGHEGSQSHQYLNVSPRPAVADSNKPRQHLCHRRGIPAPTADFLSPSSQHKRHSSHGFGLHPSSLLPSTSPSAHPASASHIVPCGVSQHEEYSHDKSAEKVRRGFESSSSTASGIPVYRGAVPGESSHVKNIMKTHRKESCASSASAVSSHHSEHTGSSLPYSSGSEGIGPTGKEMSPRKHRTKPECRIKAALTLDSTHTTTSAQERLRQREPRRADVGHLSGSARDTELQSEETLGEREAIDQFATTLGAAIVDDALLCCRDDRWLRFLSYQKPISTGNWGCGSYRGNVQLKLVIQWLAASVGQAPSLLYYTFSDERLLQAEQVVELMSSLTVGQVTAALRDYCNWVRLNLSSSFSSSLSSSTRPQLRHQTKASSAWKHEQESCLPQSLFDFLLEKFSSQENR